MKTKPSLFVSSRLKRTFGSNVSTIFIFMTFFTLCPLPSALCQIPEGFNYQAIARDGDGNLITSSFDIKVEIQNLAADTVFWIEEHNVTPNEYGLISFIVGQGTPVSGRYCDYFEDIDWASRPRYLKTSANTGSGYTEMGTTQIMSVPYSLVSKDVKWPVEKLEVKGSTTEMDEALFEVKNKDGQTIFAVYNEGVRIYVDDAAKGPKGGFAIGGFGTAKGPSQPYFIVKPDTVRVYINKTGKGPKGGFAIGGYGTDKSDIQDFLFISDDSVRIYIDNADTFPLPPKGVKGGFAIGGYGTAKGKPQDLFMVSNDSVRIYIDKADKDKGPKGGFAIGGYGIAKDEDEEYLRVTRDSTRIYVNENPSKGVKGGFAIGGFGTSKGSDPPTPFTSLTPENYLIGHRSGKALSTGKYNSFVGYETGVLNDTGSYNTILGYKSGYSNNASYNVFLGYKSGYSNSTGKSNTFLGHMAGFQNATGDNNVFLGDSAGYSNQGGKQNIFLGNGSGKANTSGEHNSFIGYQAGYKNLSGLHNAFIGYQAGFNNETGDNNSFIGHQAGFWTWKGSKNIFIGYKAGYFNYGTISATGQPGNNNIYIGESAGTNNLSGNANVYIGLEAGYGNSPDYLSPPRYNVYIGYQAGYMEYKGAWNTFIGYQAGYYNSTGRWSTFIGYQAGFNHLTGDYNTIIGYQSGVAHQTGANNTMIGNYSGYKNVNGSGNVFIGFQAGYKTRASNRLQISNTQNDSLIYGEFDNKVVRINNKLGIGITPGTTTQALEVSGNGRFTSLAGVGNRALYVDATGILTTSPSDMRMKENILPVTDALSKVLSLQGVTFSWIGDPEHIQNVGFIAQDVEKIIPEVVFTNESTGMKGINYAEITAVLAESVKEQQEIIQVQEGRLKVLEELYTESQSRIERLEKALSDINATGNNK